MMCSPSVSPLASAHAPQEAKPSSLPSARERLYILVADAPTSPRQSTSKQLAATAHAKRHAPHHAVTLSSRDAAALPHLVASARASKPLRTDQRRYNDVSRRSA